MIKIPFSAIKRALWTSAIVAILLLFIGSMRGAADFHYIVEVDDLTIENGSLVAQNSLDKKADIRYGIYITAYSSRVEETDSTPFITASGTRVRDGIVAANWLPIGTKVKIPAIFGDKIFVVEDRMHKKNSHKLDIWFPTTKGAIRFGVKKTRVEVL